MSKYGLDAMLTALHAYRLNNVGEPNGVRMSPEDYGLIPHEALPDNMKQLGHLQTIHGMEITVEPRLEPGQFAFRRIPSDQSSEGEQ